MQIRPFSLFSALPRCLLPVPSSGSMLVFLKIVLCFLALSWTPQILFSAIRAIKVVSFRVGWYLWTLVLEAPWWHAEDSSLIKQLDNCCLDYYIEKMKQVYKRRQFEEFVFFLKRFYKQVLETAVFTHHQWLNRASVNGNIWSGTLSRGLTDGRALLDLVQVALFNKHGKSG